VSGNPLVVWPNVHVRDRSGAPDRDGIDLMVRIIEARSERWRSFFDEDAMRRLAAFSGGDVRDFFRLVRECLVTLNTGGKDRVDTAVLDRVEGQLRSEHTPIAADDARWLARVAREKSTALESTEDAARLARFLDTNLIMNYLNGEPWYDVHPALCDEIRKVAGPVAP
jgi:hypothetical protein